MDRRIPLARRPAPKATARQPDRTPRARRQRHALGPAPLAQLDGAVERGPGRAARSSYEGAPDARRPHLLRRLHAVHHRQRRLQPAGRAVADGVVAREHERLVPAHALRDVPARGDRCGGRQAFVRQPGLDARPLGGGPRHRRLERARLPGRRAAARVAHPAAQHHHRAASGLPDAALLP